MHKELTQVYKVSTWVSRRYQEGMPPVSHMYQEGLEIVSPKYHADINRKMGVVNSLGLLVLWSNWVAVDLTLARGHQKGTKRERKGGSDQVMTACNLCMIEWQNVCLWSSGLCKWYAFRVSEFSVCWSSPLNANSFGELRERSSALLRLAPSSTLRRWTLR